MHRIPDIIDDQQHITFGQQFGKTRSSRINAGEAWSLTAQGIDQVFHFADQVAWVLTEGDPEDTVIKGLLNAFVMAEGFRHGGFAVATRTTQRGGDRNRLLPLLVKHFANQLRRTPENGAQSPQASLPP